MSVRVPKMVMNSELRFSHWEDCLPFRSFGFEDGISQPAIAGVEIAPQPGQVQIPGGIVLLRREGDNDDSKAPIARPSWAVDGSFLCFRKLAQLVPEFDEFLTQNALPSNDPSLPADHGKQLLGARLVGRWKSGKNLWRCL